MSIETNTAPIQRSSLASLGPDAVVTAGYFMQLLCLHFADANNINHPSLKQYVWRRDTETQINSGIYISMMQHFDPKHVGQRPAIIIKRGRITNDKDAINAQYMGNTALVGQVNANDWPTLGQSHFEYPGAGSFTFYCLHETAAAAELLGNEVFDCLLAWRPIILQQMVHFYEFMPSSIEELVKLEEAQEHWACPVVANFNMRRRVVLRPEAPLLKMLSIRTSTM